MKKETEYGVFVRGIKSIGRCKRITKENCGDAIYTGSKEDCKWFIERRKDRLMGVKL